MGNTVVLSGGWDAVGPPFLQCFCNFSTGLGQVYYWGLGPLIKGNGVNGIHDVQVPRHILH